MPKLIFRSAGVKHQVNGTEFQIKAWSELLKIPKGSTISYAELARRIGKPKAVRAVANACGANPLLGIIPCHRVIASDGSIGGFSSGLKMKRALLRSEGVSLSPRSGERWQR